MRKRLLPAIYAQAIPKLADAPREKSKAASASADSLRRAFLGAAKGVDELASGPAIAIAGERLLLMLGISVPATLRVAVVCIPRSYLLATSSTDFRKLQKCMLIGQRKIAARIPNTRLTGTMAVVEFSFALPILMNSLPKLVRVRLIGMHVARQSIRLIESGTTSTMKLAICAGQQNPNR